MPANVKSSRLIAAPPALVRASDEDLHAFLVGLPAPDFRTVADAKALRATSAADEGEGSVHSGGGSVFIVSAEVYKRAVKGHRY